MYHEKTTLAAKGKWRGILMAFGIPAEYLKNKHGPCPLCGGQDRFRWDNSEGKGTYICGQCGAGDGMKLALEYTGKPFPELASEIDKMLGNLKSEPVRPTLSDEDKRTILRKAYKSTQKAADGDLVHKYLTHRALGDFVCTNSIRASNGMTDGEGGFRPCMVAMVVDKAGKPVTMHRTFLKPDGSDKAEMAAPRKLMPGELPEGSCVRLTDYVDGQPLGIAEGIETAMAASLIYRIPVWSTINSAMMKKWCPPDGCEAVSIFGDNDPKFAGQAAAYHLAHRLAVSGISVTVHIPDFDGCSDWNDVLMRRNKAA